MRKISLCSLLLVFCLGMNTFAYDHPIYDANSGLVSVGQSYIGDQLKNSVINEAGIEWRQLYLDSYQIWFNVNCGFVTFKSNGSNILYIAGNENIYYVFVNGIQTYPTKRAAKNWYSLPNDCTVTIMGNINAVGQGVYPMLLANK